MMAFTDVVLNAEAFYGMNQQPPLKLSDLLARLEAAEAVSAQCADMLSNVAQLMDGWHSDVAWTPWDESVRKAVSEIQVKSDAWRKSKGEK